MTRGRKTTGSNEFRDYIEGELVDQLLLKYLDNPTSDVEATILEGAPFMGQFQEGSGWPEFIRQALNIYQTDSVRYGLFKALHDKVLEGKASHQERRKIVDALRLCAKQVSVIAILREAATFDDAVAEVQKRYGALLVLREHRYMKGQLKDYPGGKQHNYKRYCPAVEVWDQDTPDNAILCCHKYSQVTL